MSTLTKTFIVLTLVFSLALAVLLVLEVGKISPYNELLTTKNVEAAAAVTALQVERNNLIAKQTELAEAQRQLQENVTKSNQTINSTNAQLAQLAIQIAGLESRNSQLTNANTQGTAVINSMKDQSAELMKEIASVRPQITELIQRNAELNRTNSELLTQNRSAEQAIRHLQEAIANNTSGTGAGAAVNTTGTQVTDASAAPSGPVAPAAANQTRTPINGKITKIAQAAGHTLIETPLGSSSQVKIGTHLTIYRNNGARPVWVADAVVSNVTDDASVATVTDTNGDQTPQQGDLVMSGNANAGK